MRAVRWVLVAVLVAVFFAGAYFVIFHAPWRGLVRDYLLGILLIALCFLYRGLDRIVRRYTGEDR